ncbi:sensor histidine kinase [Arsenicibacter rosenii]|uniref:histidine kinase n=1 Tax=Arsenicibacter rosenii TaxID=1750698 RepID=A0A1S2VLW9_9BACT|nr:histidine kinase [Arsenicibacter rosenii]OIN59196.1 two-component sensor histidine kinase [Arsenicibacter rosenii]
MASTSTSLDLFVLIFGGALAMLILVAGVVAFTVLYQKRIYKQTLLVKQMEVKHQQELIYHTFEGIETERKRVARDLHDDIGAALSAMRLLVGQMISQQGETEVLAERCKQLIDNTIQSVRTISNDLLPHGLEELGLAYSLEGLCEEAANLTDADVCCDVIDLPATRPNLNLLLYRIVQELLNNAVKYAGATQISIQLTEETGDYLFVYADNGQGFDFSSAYQKKSLGLKNIETRARMLGSQVLFQTAPSAGLRVSIAIPKSSYL